MKLIIPKKKYKVGIILKHHVVYVDFETNDDFKSFCIGQQSALKTAKDGDSEYLVLGQEHLGRRLYINPKEVIGFDYYDASKQGK